MVVHFVPIDYIEKGINVIRSAVLIKEIIGMLPNIKPKDRLFA